MKDNGRRCIKKTKTIGSEQNKTKKRFLNQQAHCLCWWITAHCLLGCDQTVGGEEMHLLHCRTFERLSLLATQFSSVSSYISVSLLDQLNVGKYFTLCYIKLCCVTIRYAGVCCITLRYTVLCYIVLRYRVLGQVLLCHMLRYALLRCVELRCVTLCYVRLCYVALCYVTLLLQK